MLNKILTPLIFNLLIISPFLFLTYTVYLYFVDIYFWDTYSLVPYLVKDLNFQWLFQLHNEHWIVFTKLIYWVQYKFFHGSKIFILSLQILMQVFIFYFIHFKIKYAINNLQFFYKLFILLFISLLLATLQLSGIWHWGFAIQQQFTVLFFILAFESFYRFQKSNEVYMYLFSIIFSIFAALSSANGLIVILVIFIYSLFFLNKNIYKISNFIFLLLIYSSYMMHYLSIEKNSVNTIFSIKNFFLYFLSFIGSPFSADKTIFSIILGTIGMSILCGILYTIYINKIYKNSNTIMYFLFTLLLPLSSTFLAAIGRSRYGIEQSLDSRYIVFSGFFWIVLLVLIVLINKEKQFIQKVSRLYIYTFCIVLGILYINTNQQYKVYTAIQEDQKVQHLALQYGYYIYEPFSVFTKLFPNSEKAYENLNLLSENNYQVFLGNSNLIGKDIKTLGYTIADKHIINKNIEEIKTYLLPEQNGKLKFAYEFKGWAEVDKDFLDAKVLVANEKGIIVGMGMTGFSRKDVAQYLKVKEYKYGIRGFIINENSKIDDLKYYILTNDNILINI